MDYKGFLKRFSGVDSKFIDDFFALYDNNSLPSDHVINIEVAATYYCYLLVAPLFDLIIYTYHGRVFILCDLCDLIDDILLLT